MVVAAGPLLESRHSAVLRHESRERVGELAAVPRVLQQPNHRAVEDPAVRGTLVHHFLVAVQVALALSEGVGADHDLHEPPSLLDQLSGDDAFARNRALSKFCVYSTP